MYPIPFTLLTLLILVALATLSERNLLASHQRRLGPTLFPFGLLQPLADGLNLFLTTFLIPSSSLPFLFIFSPFYLFTLALLSYLLLPPLLLSSTPILALLTLSSLSIYSILFSGWSAYSNYAFLGALRASSQLLTYELLISLLILPTLSLTSHFNPLTWSTLAYASQPSPFLLPLLPIAILFFLATLAETNRAPFDLPEAESELVAGYFTEHAALPFSLFYLAEYAFILLYSALIPLLFSPNFPSVTLLFFFSFIWIRATFPRLRYLQLLSFSWRHLLILSFSLLFFTPILPLVFR